MATVTPTKAPRKRTISQVSQQMASGCEGQQARDVAYVSKELSAEGGERLAAHVAGLLRDGVLQQAVQKVDLRNPESCRYDL